MHKLFVVLIPEENRGAFLSRTCFLAEEIRAIFVDALVKLLIFIIQSETRKNTREYSESCHTILVRSVA